MSFQTERITIMGAGNTIMADEGVGPRALELLDSIYEFPANVELMDVGTTGFTILDFLRETDHLIVLDAAQGTGHEPGTVILFSAEELADNQVMHSAHDARLIDVLKSASLMGVELKSTLIIGAQVASLAQWVLDLSPELEAALPVMVAACLEVLEERGIVPKVKEGAEVPAAILEARRDFEFKREE